MFLVASITMSAELKNSTLLWDISIRLLGWVDGTDFLGLVVEREIRPPGVLILRITSLSSNVISILDRVTIAFLSFVLFGG